MFFPLYLTRGHLLLLKACNSRHKHRNSFFHRWVRRCVSHIGEGCFAEANCVINIESMRGIGGKLLSVHEGAVPAFQINNNVALLLLTNLGMKP